MNEKNRLKRIYDFISIIRLITLLVFGISVFNEYMKQINFKIDTYLYLYDIAPVFIFLVILALTSGLWFSSIYNPDKHLRYNVISFIEKLLHLVVFTALISYNPYVTQYKLLFLLVIITSVIQYGYKYGMLTSLLSSAIVLTVDLVRMPGMIVNEYFQNDLILVGIFIITAWLLGYYGKIEKEHRDYMTNLAIMDGLTEVYNHRHFFDYLKKTLEEANEINEHVSLLFIDIDHFKHYNDLFGHQQGDSILKEVAAILKENVRMGDFIARYGGEEFAIILPGTEENDALAIAERIRVKVEEAHFEGEEYQPNGKLTVSIGVSVYPDKVQSDTDLVKSADDALYRAKFFNKNRVESYFSILSELKSDIKEKDRDLLTSIKTLISVINAKDRYTYGHTERVVIFSQMLGQALNLSQEDMKTLKYGAYLHDIGKIHIPQEILNKKMPLTSEEWDLLKQHPINGVEIIEPVETLDRVKPLILHHHERYDGQGYPSGLSGRDIPYLARVMNVVDSFDAMTSNRTYKARRGLEDAFIEIRRCSGTQFDPEIAEAFIKLMEANKDKFDSFAKTVNE